MRTFHVLLKHPCVLNFIVGANIVLCIPMIVVSFRCSFIAYTIAGKLENGKDKNNIEWAVKSFKNLNGKLNNALQVLAVIIVMTILTTSALRQSLIAVLHAHNFEIFPIQSVYAYGLFFSVFLALVYVPNYLFMKYSSSQVIDHLNSKKNAVGTQEALWAEQLLSVMQIGKTSMDSIKLVITVLSPLLSIVIPDKLHFF
jgi:hypothetical protein